MVVVKKFSFRLSIQGCKANGYFFDGRALEVSKCFKDE